MYSIGNADIIEADLQLPYQGPWIAEVRCTPDATFSAGNQVNMSLGSLELNGTVVRGSSNSDSARFLVVGGAGGWRKKLIRRFYINDSGVKLSLVLRDLGTDAGEKTELVSSMSTSVVGSMWTRYEDLGTNSLNALRVPWRMRPDGVVVVGPQSIITSTAQFSISSYDAMSGTARVEFPEDSMDELLPGTTIDADGFKITARNVRFIVGDGSIYARVTE